MIAAALCALFAVCTPPAAPPPAAVASHGPAWEQTAVIAVPLVAGWEGLRTTSYLDRLAVPPVWTICYGDTRGVRPGETRTRAECDAGLRAGLREYWAGFRGGLSSETIGRRLTVHVDAAFTSLTWNVGVAAVRRSTAVRRLNEGDVAGACKALTWWDRAGNRVVRGLVNRRAAEYAVCMTGLRA